MAECCAPRKYVPACIWHGLGTVVRAWFDRHAVTKAMGLTHDQQILPTLAVGHAKR